MNPLIQENFGMEDFFHYFVKDIVLMYCLYQQMLSDM